MKKPNPYVQCFYCEEMLKRPQGRAAHIRKAHPGAPYRPTPEQIAEYKASQQPAVPPPVEMPAVQPAAPLTPREHLVAAITEVKGQLGWTRQQVPALETQLEGLRAAQVRMEQDLNALDVALASIDGTNEQQLQGEPEAQPLVVQSASPVPLEPSAMQPSPRRTRHQRLVAREAGV